MLLYNHFRKLQIINNVLKKNISCQILFCCYKMLGSKKLNAGPGRWHRGKVIFLVYHCLLALCSEIIHSGRTHGPYAVPGIKLAQLHTGKSLSCQTFSLVLNLSRIKPGLPACKISILSVVLLLQPPERHFDLFK